MSINNDRTCRALTKKNPRIVNRFRANFFNLGLVIILKWLAGYLDFGSFHCLRVSWFSTWLSPTILYLCLISILSHKMVSIIHFFGVRIPFVTAAYNCKSKKKKEQTNETQTHNTRSPPPPPAQKKKKKRSLCLSKTKSPIKSYTVQGITKN